MIRRQNSNVTVNAQSVHRQFQASTEVFSRLIWEIFHSLVDRFLWQVDNPKRFLEFGDCLRLCFKLAVSLQHCTPLVIIYWVYKRRIWRPLVLCDEI